MTLFRFPQTDIGAIGTDVTAIKTETDKIASIKTQTDTIPTVKTETDKIASIKTETDKIAGIEEDANKIANVKIDLINDTPWNIGWHVAFIFARQYSRDRWLGKHPTPVGENTIAQSLSVDGSLLPFTITTGVTPGTFGAWVQILGYTDGPFSVPTYNTFLPHAFTVVEVSSTEPYIIQAAGGPSTTYRDTVVSVGRAAEIYYKANSTATDSMIVPINVTHAARGKAVWVRAKTLNVGNKTISLYFGVSELYANTTSAAQPPY